MHKSEYCLLSLTHRQHAMGCNKLRGGAKAVQGMKNKIKNNRQKSHIFSCINYPIAGSRSKRNNIEFMIVAIDVYVLIFVWM